MLNINDELKNLPQYMEKYREYPKTPELGFASKFLPQNDPNQTLKNALTAIGQRNSLILV